MSGDKIPLIFVPIWDQAFGQQQKHPGSAGAVKWADIFKESLNESGS